MSNEIRKTLRFKLIGGTLVQVPDAPLGAPLMPNCITRLWSDALAMMEKDSDGVADALPAMKSRCAQMRIDPYDVHWEDFNFQWSDFHLATQQGKRFFVDVSIDVETPIGLPNRMNSDQSNTARSRLTVTAKATFEKLSSGEWLPILWRPAT